MGVFNNINRYKEFENVDKVCAYTKGRMFGKWIDEVLGASRSNGLNENDLIQSPGYVLESLLRDEIFTERDLTITQIDGTLTSLDIDKVLNTTADYYKYAFLHNVDRDAYVRITASGGSLGIDNRLACTVPVSWAVGDKCFLSNVQGDYIIDTATFDSVGNTTNGTRKDWKMTRSISKVESVTRLIDSLLFESYLLLGGSGSTLKLFTLDYNSGTVDTFSNPLKFQGKELIGYGFTDIRNVFSDYTLNYNFDAGSNKRRSQLKYSDDGGTYNTECLQAKAILRGVNKFEYEAEWLSNDTTAGYFIDRLIAYNTTQKLIVNYSGDFKNHCKYEVGDQVKINHHTMPTALNNSARFVITRKNIVPSWFGNHQVDFTLMQVPS